VCANNPTGYTAVPHCALGQPGATQDQATGFLYLTFLAAQPKEGLEALARSCDEVLAKYACRDGPGIQTVIKPTIEAEMVEQCQPAATLLSIG
jgi:hypothetical protein